MGRLPQSPQPLEQPKLSAGLQSGLSLAPRFGAEEQRHGCERRQAPDKDKTKAITPQKRLPGAPGSSRLRALPSPLDGVKGWTVAFTESCDSGLKPQRQGPDNLPTPACGRPRGGASAEGLGNHGFHQRPEAEDLLHSGPGPGAPGPVQARRRLRHAVR